ncbi:MAG: hypothetical protein KKD44_04040 [Proteobacteria bacterium]|nr:hypothetical protein [Pseudomonadota bacterium]
MKHPFLMMITGFIVTGLLGVYPAMAAYSDHYSRQSSAQNSANSTLNHGGTYSQAGQNYVNNRDNWKVPNSTDTGQGSGEAEMTPEERAEYNRTMKKTNNMLNKMFNEPHHFGPQPTPMSPNDAANMDATMQRNEALIKQIENDPLLK